MRVQIRCLLSGKRRTLPSVNKLSGMRGRYRAAGQTPGDLSRDSPNLSDQPGAVPKSWENPFLANGAGCSSLSSSSDATRVPNKGAGRGGGPRLLLDSVGNLLREDEPNTSSSLSSVRSSLNGERTSGVARSNNWGCRDGVGEAGAFQTCGDANAENADWELGKIAAFSLLSLTFSLSVSPSAGVRDCQSCPPLTGVGDFVPCSRILKREVEGTKILELFTFPPSSSESLIHVLTARDLQVGGTFLSCSSVSSPDPTMFSGSRMNGGGGLFSRSLSEGEAEQWDREP